MTQPWYGGSAQSRLSPTALSRLRAVLLVVGITALMWVLEVGNLLLGGPLYEYGIQPRSTDHLPYIFTAPFLHYGLPHLIANSVPMLVLGSLVAFSGLARFLGASVLIIMISGFGVWLVSGAGTMTLGASGLVFGYFGFLVLRGIIERKTADIVIMICVVIFYGGMIFGMSPLLGQQGISWQAHLFGFIGGLVAAYLLPKREARSARGGYGPPGGGYSGFGGRY